MNSFVFVTYHGTILSVSPDGKLVHGPRATTEPNLVFDREGRITSAPAHTKLHDVGTSVSIGSGGKFALKKDEDFVCAMPQGTTGVRRVMNSWEIFTPVPTAALIGKDTNEYSIAFKRRAFHIPKTVHQTYKTEKLPSEVNHINCSLKQDNLDWNFVLWTDKHMHDFIYEYYGWDILKLYLRINPRYGAARADLWRYLCIYQLGGVYLDIKSTASAPLSHIIKEDDQYVLCQWDHQFEDERFHRSGMWPELSHIPGGEFQQWHIISTAGHPFLERVINDVINNIQAYDERFDGYGKKATLRVTGPIAYTLAINRIIMN